MEQVILDKETAVMKVIQIGNTGNIGNVVVDIISSNLFSGKGKRITTIPNPIMGKIYEQKSNLVPMGYGVNWEIVESKLID